ncbi:MAG: hypothetical protein CM15mP18_1880 [Methanobacteriota archaeon]|nr:MAG: hypothetical protein CM15mP18_1880 [Euryarchaeota archaeon]
MRPALRNQAVQAVVNFGKPLEKRPSPLPKICGGRDGGFGGPPCWVFSGNPLKAPFFFLHFRPRGHARPPWAKRRGPFYPMPVLDPVTPNGALLRRIWSGVQRPHGKVLVWRF